LFLRRGSGRPQGAATGGAQRSAARGGARLGRSPASGSSHGARRRPWAPRPRAEALGALQQAVLPRGGSSSCGARPPRPAGRQEPRGGPAAGGPNQQQALHTRPDASSHPRRGSAPPGQIEQAAAHTPVHASSTRPRRASSTKGRTKQTKQHCACSASQRQQPSAAPPPPLSTCRLPRSSPVCSPPGSSVAVLSIRPREAAQPVERGAARIDPAPSTSHFFMG